MRTPFGRYPEYHTSADNLTFVRPEALADSLQTCLQVCALLEHNHTYVSLNPKCEPQLGKRGLYRPIGGTPPPDGVDGMVLLWMLNLADGKHSLLDIAERAGCSFAQVSNATQLLVERGLLQVATVV
jgi:aminopeptidase-like protein